MNCVVKSTLLVSFFLSFLSTAAGQNSLAIQDVTGRLGETVETSILMTTTASTHGFSLGVSHDESQLSLPANAVNEGLILSGALTPVFWQVNVFPTGFTIGCVTDFSFPFLTIPPGADMEIVTVAYLVAPDALFGSTPLSFTTSLGDPPVPNVLVQLLVEIVPVTTNGSVLVLDPEFLRGDVNGDGQRSLIDGITFLYRFALILPEGPCHDADDFDDNGSLDLSDAIAIFGYLFINGSPPPAPFETCGPDTTPDGLNCTSHSHCP
ncbi:MAG TPA: hypothetical protein EYN79_04970 [Planctomycetes bacterium]|nr:hypothetical protein [Planctomycetota bacterium]